MGFLQISARTSPGGGGLPNSRRPRHYKWPCLQDGSPGTRETKVRHGGCLTPRNGK